MNKRAVIYARYSSDLQSDASIEDQVRLCEERLRSDGNTVVQVYQVAIISGGKLKAAGALTEIMKQLTQARLLEIQLNTESQLEAAEKVVREFAEEGAEVTTSDSERTVRIRTQRPEDQWNVLLEGLVGAKVQLSQFREIQTDLEDAYLSVTQSASQQDENRSTANV